MSQRFRQKRSGERGVVQVGASVGIAAGAAPYAEDAVDDLVAAGDAAMYAEKARGRHRAPTRL